MDIEAICLIPKLAKTIYERAFATSEVENSIPGFDMKVEVGKSLKDPVCRIETVRV
jgi:hypothetical protein